MPDERVRDDVIGHAPGGVEPPDVPLRPILWVALGIVLFTATSLLALNAYRRAAVPAPLVERPRTFAPPALQQDPAADLARLQRDQRLRLESYAWVDRGAGIARMPIDEAMRSLSERGESAYDAPDQPERVPSLGSRGGASGGLPGPDGQPGAVSRPADKPERR